MSETELRGAPSHFSRKAMAMANPSSCASLFSRQGVAGICAVPAARCPPQVARAFLRTDKRGVPDVLHLREERYVRPHLARTPAEHLPFGQVRLLVGPAGVHLQQGDVCRAHTRAPWVAWSGGSSSSRATT